MADLDFHRIIYEDPVNSTEAAEFCSVQCDRLQNLTGNCISFCSFICPSVCNTTDSSPPLSPAIPTGGYIINGPPEHHHSSLSLPLKISLVVLVLTFSIFLLYTLYKFYTIWYRSRRRRSPPAPENQETHDEFLDHDVIDHPIWYIRTIGLQPSVINAITVVKYGKTDGLIDGSSCSVCLSDFQEDETLRLLPKCNHAFHISCIDTWLRSHTNCPLCRAGIVKNTTNSSSAASNLDDLGQTVDTQIAITIAEDANGEQSQMEDDNRSSDLIIGIVGEEQKGEIVGGSAMRRSVSLNDYAAFRIRSDVLNNNYYSARHDVQIQSIDGNLGFDLVKVDQTSINRPQEEN
ncbi:hypothetical protein R6Q59_020720 [Mikania micrantha]|uniref:RING-type E3 ubiquitin transferase n=1 Tax=Mikania micrantha TaxID=192012 RepID=A0A5N6PQM7_9ASTR|nr:hypothetical protein E3N88_06276 [Mikania micrantha]